MNYHCWVLVIGAVLTPVVQELYGGLAGHWASSAMIVLALVGYVFSKERREYNERQQEEIARFQARMAGYDANKARRKTRKG